LVHFEAEILMAGVLFIFLDGVGLEDSTPEQNPFAAAPMPELMKLLDGRKLLSSSAPFEGEQATLLAIDACLGVEGNPQSASGQAALLTGRNVPAEIGMHYGPKPNPDIAAILKDDNLFCMVKRRGGTSSLINAYPPRYFDAIQSGHRLYSAIPLAITEAGQELMTAEDLQNGRALAADFTGAGWVAQPNFPPAPVYSSEEAGDQLALLSQSYDLTWFEYWPTDYVGHRGTMDEALMLLDTFDSVLGSLARAWDNRQDLIVITSDHGNLEDITGRGHTRNPVPALLIGPSELRHDFATGLKDLTDFTPAVLQTIFGSDSSESES
jgi:hypothetical protein